jgi:signal transduction histidine kinase
MRLQRQRSASPPWPHLPRLTARLRLTLLYGALFLVCGVALIGITYLLLARVLRPYNLSGTVTHSGQQISHVRLNLGRGQVLRQLLAESGIALGIVGTASFVLGWLVAGRILRPLATITATARRISATSLHERLDLPGPGDELKELGDTLDGLFARLEASFHAQRHFVANASHELRTPLTADRTLLQVALDDPAVPGKWQAVGAELLASNTEQERLIDALLTLASSEGGLDHHEPVDLPAVTDTVLLASRPETSRLGLHVEAITKPAPLHGDPVLTQRLVANLIDNAVRHNIPGGHVRITTGTSRGRAILSVSNTGPVIPPDQVDRLFQPFQRLHSRRARNHNGHGLGLSIVQAIATTHAASITAQAPPTGGLTVTVTFPPPPTPHTPTVNPLRTRRNHTG